jgi:LAS superfamily LD-carboxypeptidase LdcB
MAAMQTHGLQAMGLDASHLTTVDESVHLAVATANALMRLQARARSAGFDLAVASAYRSYQRQLLIFNQKALGLRTVYNDIGETLSRDACADDQWLHAILRYSALPGTSRHHWGSDVDVYDRAAVDADYVLQLVPSEYQVHGPFNALNEWLADLMVRDDAEGFFRPYASDRGGVAPEPWHLSFRPDAAVMADSVSEDLLTAVWRNQMLGFDVEPLALRSLIEAQLPQLRARYWQLD